MVNGASAGEIDSRRQRLVEPPGPGFARLTVIDATGAADTVVSRMQSCPLSGCESARRLCGTDGRDLCPNPRFGEPREHEATGESGQPARPRASTSRRTMPARAVACGCSAPSLFFLPGFFTIPPIDRDEARFAQATKQMVESGDFVDIRFQDDVRYKKPVGIYWMQAAAVEAADAVGLAAARRRASGSTGSHP